MSYIHFPSDLPAEKPRKKSRPYSSRGPAGAGVKAPIYAWHARA